MFRVQRGRPRSWGPRAPQRESSVRRERAAAEALPARPGPTSLIVGTDRCGRPRCARNAPAPRRTTTEKRPAAATLTPSASAAARVARPLRRRSNRPATSRSASANCLPSCQAYSFAPTSQDRADPASAAPQAAQQTRRLHRSSPPARSLHRTTRARAARARARTPSASRTNPTVVSLSCVPVYATPFTG